MNTKDVYDRFASEYHEKRLNADRSLWNEYLDVPMVMGLIGDEISGQWVADLGCGSGLFSARLKNLGALVEGVDSSAKLIEIARRNIPDGHFSVADVTDTMLPGRCFDLAVSCLVMHYLNDLTGFFKEVHRILKSDGHFVFSFHHPFNEVLQKNEDNMVLKPYFHSESYRWMMLEGMELTSFHLTFEAIVEALFMAGFVVERVKEARASADFQKTHPEFYQFASRYPSFAAIKARMK